MFSYTFLKVLFDTIQLHGWLKLSVRKMGNPIFISTDSYKFFHVGIPGGDVFIPNGPVHCDSLLGIGLEVQITPALGPPSPGQGFATDLIASDPVKRLYLLIGMLLVLHKKMLGSLIESIATTGYWIFLQYLMGN